jgi:lipoate-protein ligase A
MTWHVEYHRGEARELLGRSRSWRPAIAVLDVVRPSVILGSSQPQSAIDARRAAAGNVAVARRASGGGAVYVEPGVVLWLDVTIPPDHPRWDTDVGRAFHWLGEAWVQALARLDVAAQWHDGPIRHTPWSKLVCFAGLGPGEVTVDGRKAVGMSQRRTRAGALFQCCALLVWDPAALLNLTTLTESERRQAVADVDDRAVGLGPAVGPALHDAFLEVVVGPSRTSM